MKRLQRLINLNKYLREFSLPNQSIIRATDQGDVTGRLARVAGDQLVIAMPELSLEGADNDTFTGEISMAFFAIFKAGAAARTEETDKRDFSRMEGLISDALSMLDRTMGEQQCHLLGGLRISSLYVVPEYSIFGGWSGYSAEIRFSW